MLPWKTSWGGWEGAGAARGAAGSSWDSPPWGNTSCFPPIAISQGIYSKKDQASHVRGLEGLKTRGSPLLGSVGLVQGKGCCGIPAGAGPPGRGTPAVAGQRQRQAGCHSVFIVGSVLAGTYTSGTVGTLGPARQRGPQGDRGRGSSWACTEGDRWDQASPCFCGWQHHLGSIPPALAASHPPRSIPSTSTSEHPICLGAPHPPRGFHLHPPQSI